MGGWGDKGMGGWGDKGMGGWGDKGRIEFSIPNFELSDFDVQP